MTLLPDLGYILTNEDGDEGTENGRRGCPKATFSNARQLWVMAALVSGWEV